MQIDLLCKTFSMLYLPGTKEVCSDGERERQVYSSVSNVLEVRVVDRVREDAALYFFLKYQGKVMHLACNLTIFVSPDFTQV